MTAIRNELHTMITDILNIDAVTLTEAEHLSDLQIESLNLMLLISDLEDKYQIEILESEVRDLVALNFDGLVDYVSNKLKITV